MNTDMRFSVMLLKYRLNRCISEISYIAEKMNPVTIKDKHHDENDNLKHLKASIGSICEKKCEHEALNANSESTRKRKRDQSESESVELCIVVKSAMHSNYCYLGYDLIRNRLFRPIHQTTEEKCFWETDMEVDCVYNFKVLQFPDENKPLGTLLPHSNDDLLVDKTVDQTENHIDAKLLYHKLDLIAKNSVQEIFTSIINNSYVNEMDNCPSVGILRSHGANINVVPKRRRFKVKIGLGEYPYTGLDAANMRTPPSVDPKSTALVIMGFARPWKGKYSEYSPKRCTLLVLRILQLP